MKEKEIFHKEKCVIADLEGTLSNHTHRINYYKNKEYDQYNSGFKNDPVNDNMRMILNSIEDSVHVILCTAKSVEHSDEVKKWLKKNELFDKFDELFFREELDSRSSVLVKRDQLKKVLDDYDVVCAYDDREDICKMYETEGIKASIVSCFTAEENKRTPDKVLESASKTFKEKNEEYGDAWKRHGKILAEFFPNGIELKTEKDFFKFHMFNLDIMKSNRIASNYVKGRNHSDSWLDKMVFSSMVKGEK